MSSPRVTLHDSRDAVALRTDGEGEAAGDPIEAGHAEVPDALAHISVDEWRRIQAFASTPAHERDPDLLLPDAEATPASTATNPVTAERCRRIRRTMSEAVTVREVVAEFPRLHRSEIFRHAYGDCAHDHATPATASPQLRREECHAMRQAFAEGLCVSEIAEEWSRAENTTNRHVFGRCSHGSVPRSVSPSEIPDSDAERLVSTVEANGQVGVAEIACAMRLRPEVAATVVALHEAGGNG